MLYTEPAGEGAIRHNDDAFTTVRFGEAVYSQIRRFVIVSVRQNFVHACAISTYRGQGTLKKGCDPREHAIVFNTGVDPRTCLLTGETEKGLYKDAIEVRPADTGSYLVRESRIRFGHVYSIEFNVKVKDIGRVVSRDLSVLLAHYDEENGRWNQNAYE
ncbi:hypothetical protein E8E12_001741 [Didymella heteroderae]|uniref:DUF6590 domain-containing protein n=1 Tax=Didymella heteroderae TaxID=1769908 RepID=A0A9P4WKC5_9PLEO|nr:hypothetical protein E8E12_001741 [Didymella heteroderae]